MPAIVILGAGFSFVAGLPLIRNLFDVTHGLPRAQSKESERHHLEVASAYAKALIDDPSLQTEIWLARLYKDRENPLQLMRHGTTWERAIRFALARLVNLPPGSKSHYYYGIGNSQCHPVHERFWKLVENKYAVKFIVTLNYDILVEQALHTTRTTHRTAPRCQYGGFPYGQVLPKMTDVINRKHEDMHLGDDFVLFKLHGSVNWAKEPHSTQLKVHQDVRAVFRTDERFGTPAIVPPIPEKEMPERFLQVWADARAVLRDADTWIVCGYSLPDYDEALREFFGSILNARQLTKIVVLDPQSDAVAERWQKLSKNCRTFPHPGLPEALDVKWL